MTLREPRSEHLSVGPGRRLAGAAAAAELRPRRPSAGSAGRAEVPGAAGTAANPASELHLGASLLGLRLPAPQPLAQIAVIRTQRRCPPWPIASE